MTYKFIAMHGAIKEITVIRETKATVWFAFKDHDLAMEHRYQKTGDWYWFGETFDEAKQKMVQAYELNKAVAIEKHEEEMYFLNDAVNSAKALTPF